jgi:predicted MFS family arabinose efflux permease
MIWRSGSLLGQLAFVLHGIGLGMIFGSLMSRDLGVTTVAIVGLAVLAAFAVLAVVLRSQETKKLRG